MTKPLKQSGGRQECGGMHRWRARGFLNKFVRIVPSLSVTVRSINSTSLFKVVKVHVSPLWLPWATPIIICRGRRVAASPSSPRPPTPVPAHWRAPNDLSDRRRLRPSLGVTTSLPQLPSTQSVLLVNSPVVHRYSKHTMFPNCYGSSGNSSFAKLSDICPPAALNGFRY